MATEYSDRPEQVVRRVFVLLMVALNAYPTVASIHFPRLKVWGLGVSTVCCAAAYWVTGTIQHRRLAASASWPSATGTVFSANIWQATDAIRSQWIVKITYSYVAQGERYAGFADRVFRKESEADAEVARLRSASVIVKHDPRKPETSLLSE
jgi:hypothetical protein